MGMSVCELLSTKDFEKERKKKQRKKERKKERKRSDLQK
jgi:hypothetical protein